MARIPSPADARSGAVDPMVQELAALRFDTPAAGARIEIGRPGRELCLYPGLDGYDLQEELDYLSHRAMEPNVFFTGRFLAPAMPRLDDRQVSFALIRDRKEATSRMRLLMPLTVERPGFGVGPSIIRVWANHFAPLGTPLVDAEDAAETLDNLLEGLARSELGLPGVLVMPDMRLNGRVSRLLKAIALGRNLQVTAVNPTSRPMLESREEGEIYLRNAISTAHMREMRRQWRHLEELGTLVYAVARQPRDIYRRFEEFLAMEAGGWKGRRRSALATDRHHTAFAREAISNLAETDQVRIHTLDLNGKAIAAVVVLMLGGEAFTWKTAYDEAHARFSPGKLLMAELTEWHLEDSNIQRSDSCAVSDHPIMSRLWQEREDMGTLIVALTQNGDRDLRQVSAQLHMYQSTRSVARRLRDKILSLAGRG